MESATKTEKPSAWIFLMAVFYALYLALALACLRHWGSPEPWRRIDIFSGGFLALSLPWMAESIYFCRAVGRSKEVRREASGMTYDPGMMKGLVVLPVLELTVFLDYGHWRLVPALEHRALQGFGLAVYMVTPAFMVWADSYLGRHFSRELAARRLITQGPFRWIRHPRYAGLMVNRLAFALVFASVLAWVFALGWLWLVLRRIRLEERHLLGSFGAQYEAYALRTPRLMPGIY